MSSESRAIARVQPSRKVAGSIALIGSVCLSLIAAAFVLAVAA
ncbi:hypothetical protein ACIA8C_42270 [Nocardia sp. NPDC051321]